MPRPHPSYSLECRRQMVEFVRSGRNPEELAREFEPSVQTIRSWVKQAELDEGRRAGPMGRPAPSVRSCVVCVGRIAGFARSGRFQERPRPGSPGKPDRADGSVPIREGAKGATEPSSAGLQPPVTPLAAASVAPAPENKLIGTE
jgi:hypothetical protein